MRTFVSGLFTQYNIFEVHPWQTGIKCHALLGVTTIAFCGCSTLGVSFIAWWTCGCFLSSSCCEGCCCEHSHPSTDLSTCFHFLGARLCLFHDYLPNLSTALPLVNHPHILLRYLTDLALLQPAFYTAAQRPFKNADLLFMSFIDFRIALKEQSPCRSGRVLQARPWTFL